MHIRKTLLAVTLNASLLAISAFCQVEPQEPTDHPANQLKALTDGYVSPLLTGQNALRGLVVGVVHNGQRETWGYGKAGKKGKTPSGETLFNIASVTKPFTALLLAQLAVEEKLTYDDTAIRFKDHTVSYHQLVTHTSGLPLLPPDTHNSSIEGFRRFLDEYSLSRDPGSKFEYSTTGYGVLGMCLTQKCAFDTYDTSLTEKILSPLGMSSTIFELSESDQSRFAGDILPQTGKSDSNPFDASGGLISSARDLLCLISANLQPQAYPDLAEAIILTQKTCPEIQTFPGSIASLGWHVITPMNFYWHSGVGQKYRAFVTFDLKSQTGVVMLTNTSILPTDPKLEMAGFALLGGLASMTSDNSTKRKNESSGPDEGVGK